MSAPDSSRFQAQNKTTQQRVSDQTVGLVKLSDFRKRRAEVIEQQEREVREAAVAANNGTDRSQTGTPDPYASSDASNHNSSGNNEKANGSQKKLLGGSKKRKVGSGAKSKLSFGDDDEEGEGEGAGEDGGESTGGGKEDKAVVITKKAKFKPNTNVSIVPRAVTKSALQREAAERDALRREFLLKQEAVKATEIAIPFVFYDGTNLPGGIARVKKGDFTWIFLDKSRKIGAQLGVNEKTNARREWARIGVDDLMLVRGGLIIPHHYEFLYFIMNKTLGPNHKILFDYSSEPPALSSASDPTEDASAEAVSTPASRAAKVQPDISTLEGASDDPTFTKVVDRRWYQRNKHIYPASTWQDFEPENDYQGQLRKDPRSGNTYFY